MLDAALLLTVMIIVALIAATIARALRATMTTANAIAARIAPVLAALREGRTPSPDEIQALAADQVTRVALYRALRSAGRGDLFPREYDTAEALGDADAYR